MGADVNHEQPFYGIGAVARLTGLTDHTIRVWERRYAAVVAERAANGRRIYKPADVEKLILLKRLTDRGDAISQIAGSTIDELRERAQSMSEMSSTQHPDRVGTAVLGDFLPGALRHYQRDLAPLDVVLTDDSSERFLADVQRYDIDVVVMESPVLDDASLDQLTDCMKRAGAPRGVVLYGFGRARDVDRCRDFDVIALRSPANVDDVRGAILRAYTPPTAVAKPKAQSKQVAAQWRFDGPVAPRRFSRQQLATLSQASTSIDCECPHHLAELVSDLSAFEIYSANCASRDEDDAALHAYLHRTTAEARALIEVALEKVADAEGISV